MLLKLLSSLSLTSDTGRVPAAAQQRKRLELLAILGVAGKQGISRERLLSFLWPESAGDRARHALDQLIYAVRRSLELDPILAEGRDIKLDQSVISTDLGSFDSAISDERWADAVSRYRGPLLDGFTFPTAATWKTGSTASVTALLGVSVSPGKTGETGDLCR